MWAIGLIILSFNIASFATPSKESPPKLDADSEAVLTSLRAGETGILCVHAASAADLTQEFNRKLNAIRRRVTSANAEHVTSTVDPSAKQGRHTLCAVISRSSEEGQPDFVNSI